jgi:hypothetical protein
VPETFLDAPGRPVATDELATSRANELVRFLGEAEPPFVQLLGCRHIDSPPGDVTIVEVEVELGQRQVNDIRRFERLAIVFWDDDGLMPEILALRDDFPSVPHINLRLVELPRSLCLYDEPWRDLKRTWTPLSFIERIRWWLAQTAAGTLHGADQPLEPLLMDSSFPLVIADEVLQQSGADAPELLAIWRTGDVDERCTLIADRGRGDLAPTGQQGFVATVIHGTPQTHGVIRWLPATLRNLHAMMATVGDDLLGELRARLQRWENKQDLLDRPIILIIVLPKSRTIGGPVESYDTRAFICGLGDATPCPLGRFGQEIGVWEVRDGVAGRLLQIDEAKDGEQIHLVALNPVPALSQAHAARLNGQVNVTTSRIAAIGAGALGSQVATNLARAGWGQWTVIDEDVVLPHNLARHALFGSALGRAKARALATMLNFTVDGEPITEAIIADVLTPGPAAERVDGTFRDAEVILDMSASVTVARYLARDVNSAARRISLFLNPDGTDVVILAEDRARATRLDNLELQLYRSLINDPRLCNHLIRKGGQIRYGRTCRDVSSELPQELVALHAAIGSRAVRNTTRNDAARIAVWQAHSDDLAVDQIEIEPADMVERVLGEWRLCTDRWLMDKIARLRAEKLPNETGGVLIGAFDRERKIAYVVDTIPSPPDSTEWPAVYIRGARGLRTRVEEIGLITDGMLGYTGEWHAHPTGCGVTPSNDDRKAFAWLAGNMAHDGLPPLMLIVGDDEFGWHIERIPEA